MSQSSVAIRSVIVPLEQEPLLLPGSIVAEIVAYAQMEPPPTGSPAWMVGILHWREQQVPLVSVEAFVSGGAVPQVSGAGRIAVLKALTNKPELLYYGIITKQIPRLTTIRPGELESVDGGNTRPGMSMDVVLGGETLTIPDVDALEDAVRSVWIA